jgi:hypothetical protein
MSWDDHIGTLAMISGTLIVLIAVVLVAAVGLQPMLNPAPTSTPTPTPKPSPSPSPSPGPWDISVGNGSITNGSITNGSHTASPSVAPKPNVTTTPEWNIPEPTITPVPTPDPFLREKLSLKRDIDVLPNPDHTSTTPGLIAYDPAMTRGIQPYYYVGDHPMIRLRFYSAAKDPLINPEITLVIKKEMSLGIYMPIISKSWTEKVTLNPGEGFYTQIFEFDVPDYTGNYILEVSVKVNGKEECWISKDLSIFKY